MICTRVADIDMIEAAEALSRMGWQGERIARALGSSQQNISRCLCVGPSAELRKPRKGRVAKSPPRWMTENTRYKQHNNMFYRSFDAEARAAAELLRSIGWGDERIARGIGARREDLAAHRAERDRSADAVRCDAQALVDLIDAEWG